MTALTKTALLLAITSFCLPSCSGGTNPTPNAPNLGNPMTSPIQAQDRRDCSNDGGLRVTPCRVTFDSGNPGPVNVSVTHGGGRGPDDGGRHTIRERDDCASRNIATVTPDSGSVYTVTAGSASGSCTATFSDNGNGNGNDDHGGRGQGGGGAQLHIVNNL